LFGVAAINVGRVPEGVLALERHLAAVPGNDRARLDLARGYFELGDYVRARSEFEFVLRYNPPKDVRSNIERYLDAMQTRDAFANKASSQLYLELGAGRDSNVNAGTYNSQITLPTGRWFWPTTPRAPPRRIPIRLRVPANGSGVSRQPLRFWRR
jgi:tetratricopeptide (TPR) repeat protein